MFCVDISKVEHGYLKRFVDSCFSKEMVGEQCQTVGRLNDTVKSKTSEVKTMSTSMDYMSTYVHATLGLIYISITG